MIDCDVRELFEIVANCERLFSSPIPPNMARHGMRAPPTCLENACASSHTSGSHMQQPPPSAPNCMTMCPRRLLTLRAEAGPLAPQQVL